MIAVFRTVRELGLDGRIYRLSRRRWRELERRTADHEVNVVIDKYADLYWKKIRLQLTRDDGSVIGTESFTAEGARDLVNKLNDCIHKIERWR